jgi:holo-[acyl-carrier protein] synthase
MALEAPRIGMDVVALARVRRALEGSQEHWRRRVFTEGEWKHAQASPDSAAALALCFAAKEAAFKVLGTGWGGGVAWRDVDVQRGTDIEAVLALSGRAAEIAAEAGLTLTASLAHTDELAVAMVLGHT